MQQGGKRWVNVQRKEQEKRRRSAWSKADDLLQNGRWPCPSRSTCSSSTRSNSSQCRLLSSSNNSSSRSSHINCSHSSGSSNSSLSTAAAWQTLALLRNEGGSWHYWFIELYLDDQFPALVIILHGIPLLMGGTGNTAAIRANAEMEHWIKLTSRGTDTDIISATRAIFTKSLNTDTEQWCHQIIIRLSESRTSKDKYTFISTGFGNLKMSGKKIPPHEPDWWNEPRTWPQTLSVTGLHSWRFLMKTTWTTSLALIRASHLNPLRPTRCFYDTPLCRFFLSLNMASFAWNFRRKSPRPRCALLKKKFKFFSKLLISWRLKHT